MLRTVQVTSQLILYYHDGLDLLDTFIFYLIYKKTLALYTYVLTIFEDLRDPKKHKRLLSPPLGHLHCTALKAQ